MSSNSKQRSSRDRPPDEEETDEPDHHHHHHHQQQQDDEKQDESPQSKVRTTTFHGSDWRCSSVRKKKIQTDRIQAADGVWQEDLAISVDFIRFRNQWHLLPCQEHSGIDSFH